MFVHPETLIAQTIENLQLLSELLRDDSDELIYRAAQRTSETDNNKEALRSIDALVPRLRSAAIKLRAARVIHELHGLPPQRLCTHCDD